MGRGATPGWTEIEVCCVSTPDMVSVRLAALVLACCLVLAGCGGSQETLTGEATPATVGDDTLSATDWERVTTTERRLTTTVTVTLQGDSELTSRRSVNATTHVAVYRDTRSPPTVLALWSVPALKPLEGTDLTVNPVARRSPTNLTGDVQSTYSGVGPLSRTGNASMTLLGADRQFAVADGTATGPEGSPVPVTVVSATVEHEGDFVVVLAVVPEGRSPTGTVAPLVGNVTH